MVRLVADAKRRTWFAVAAVQTADNLDGPLPGRFDSDRMEGNIVKKMTSGIDDSATVAVFVTKRCAAPCPPIAVRSSSPLLTTLSRLRLAPSAGVCGALCFAGGLSSR